MTSAGKIWECQFGAAGSDLAGADEAVRAGHGRAAPARLRKLTPTSSGVRRRRHRARGSLEGIFVDIRARPRRYRRARHAAPRPAAVSRDDSFLLSTSSDRLRASRPTPGSPSPPPSLQRRLGLALSYRVERTSSPPPALWDITDPTKYSFELPPIRARGPCRRLPCGPLSPPSSPSPTARRVPGRRVHAVPPLGRPAPRGARRWLPGLGREVVSPRHKARWRWSRRAPARALVLRGDGGPARQGIFLGVGASGPGGR